MTSKITHDEWIAELERIQSGSVGGEGLTAREISEHWHCGTRTVLERLRLIQAAGRLVVCSKRIMGINGRLTPTTSYKIKPEAASPPAAGLDSAD